MRLGISRMGLSYLHETLPVSSSDSLGMAVESSLRSHLGRWPLAGPSVTTFEERDSEDDKQVTKVSVIVSQKRAVG